MNKAEVECAHGSTTVLLSVYHFQRVGYADYQVDGTTNQIETTML